MITRAWAATVARKLGFKEHDIDDAWQEANVAALRYPKTSHNAARYRLLDIRAGKPYTGAPPKTPGPRGQGTEVSVDYTDKEVWEIAPMNDSGGLHAVENPEVLEALKKLEQRDREIAFRFAWLQETHAEIGQAVGLTKDGVKYRWQNVIAPLLREELA